MNTLKNAIRYMLARFGYQINPMEDFSCPATEPSLVRHLVASLQPKVPDCELIRLGPDGDGGYLVPNDLEGIAACFSPGVNTVSGFELECANRNIPVFLADKSVDMPPDSHESFHFTKKYIGSTESGDFMTMAKWVEKSVQGTSSDLLLQIDIEGFEYETFFSMDSDLLRRFRIIVVEFHNLERLWDPSFFQIASRVFEKLLEYHSCVHLHPNNFFPIFSKNGVDIPSLLEVTFIRTDRGVKVDGPRSFPHPLDFDNVPENASVELPVCWYR